MTKTLHRIDHHRPKINPNLNCFNISAAHEQKQICKRGFMGKYWESVRVRVHVHVREHVRVHVSQGIVSRYMLFE